MGQRYFCNMLSWDFKFSWQNLVNPILFSLKLGMGPQALASYTVYICLLSTSIHKERSLSVSRRLPQFTVEKNVLEFLYDLKCIFYNMMYDTPTFVANYLRQSSLYNPT